MLNNIDVSNACCRSTIATGDQNAMSCVGPALVGRKSRVSFAAVAVGSAVKSVCVFTEDERPSRPLRVGFRRCADDPIEAAAPALTRLVGLLLNGLCHTGQRLRRRAFRLDLCLGSPGPSTSARVFLLSRAHYILERGWLVRNTRRTRPHAIEPTPTWRRSSSYKRTAALEASVRRPASHDPGWRAQ